MSDNGKDLPEIFNLLAMESLGMLLIRNLSDQLGANFETSQETNQLALSYAGADQG